MLHKAAIAGPHLISLGVSERTCNLHTTITAQPSAMAHRQLAEDYRQQVVAKQKLLDERDNTIFELRGAVADRDDQLKQRDDQLKQRDGGRAELNTAQVRISALIPPETLAQDRTTAVEYIGSWRGYMLGMSAVHRRSLLHLMPNLYIRLVAVA